MYNHRSKGGTKNNLYPSDFFDCSTYTLSCQKRAKACSGHYITTKSLHMLILETIRAASAFALTDQEAFLQKVREASQIRQTEAAKEIRRAVNKNRKRADDLDGIIKKLYESFAVGRISEERFDGLLAEYETEQKQLKSSIAEDEAKLAAFEEDTEKAEGFLTIAKKYTDFSELTTPMINEFIEKIVVHEPKRVDGERTQDVDIYLNFIGRYEVPVPELTAEEAKRQEQLRRHRIKSRERYLQIQAGERAVGVPLKLICQCCGETFESSQSSARFCNPNCRSKFYRQEAAKKRSRDCVCENCGKVFVATRSDVKYCSDPCREEAGMKRRKARYEAKMKQKTS